jgi:putative YphP/YqiW family bacilliredoxin
MLEVEVDLRQMFSTTPNRYPEQLISRMREDLTQYGVQETRTVDDVNRLVRPDSGTVLMVINSVCGCAAGKARPAVGLALEHPVRPDAAATVFAGADLEAVARVRELLPGMPPSSPSIALFRDGKAVFLLHRHQIESSDARNIAKLLTDAFDQYCVTAKQ